MEIDYSSLIKLAFEARENARVDYSGFAVGAALLCCDGDVYTGCNIECGAYSATICAERVAIFKAISEGKDCFRAIVIVGGKLENEIENYCPPCGFCRQVISELCCTDGFEIILAKNAEEFVIYSIDDMLPHAFGGNLL